MALDNVFSDFGDHCLLDLDCY